MDLHHVRVVVDLVFTMGDRCRPAGNTSLPTTVSSNTTSIAALYGSIDTRMYK